MGWYGYRMLRGKEGASGYLQGLGDEMRLSLQGLLPDTEYHWFSSEGERYALQSSPRGTVDQTLEAGEGFLSCADRVILWPDGADQALSFFRAQEFLDHDPDKAGEDEEPSEEMEPPAEPAAEDEAPSYSLRPESDAEPAFSLPPLLWPGELLSWKPYFEQALSLSLFDVPGWRFVQAPSACPDVPYCWLGVHMTGFGIARAMYAWPCTAGEAPSALRGCCRETAKNGRELWTIRKNFEENFHDGKDNEVTRKVTIE